MFKHLTSASQFTSSEHLTAFFKQVARMEKPWEHGRDPLYMAKGKVMATWFAEPSTRTRLSFESAMQRLGGSVIGTTDPKAASSAAKGESWEDSVKTMAEVADIIVIRTGQEGDAAKAAAASRVPVISAGDGGGEHPTQAMLDLYTIHQHFQAVDGLSVGLVGDLKHSRSIHSLLKLLGLYKNITYHTLSPDGLGLNPREFLQRGDLPVRVHKSMNELVDCGPDVLYITRQQRERHPTLFGAQVAAYSYDTKLHHLNLKQAELLPNSTLILSPLPRGPEIAVEVDQNHRAAYWRQVKNGVFVRMALIESMLDGKTVA